jgi:hypothetical protein
MTDPARLTVEQGVFELPGQDPIWIWARTCPTLGCECRSALILATSHSRQLLLERARVVDEAWHAGAGYIDVATSLDGVEVFHLDIDTVEASTPANDTPLVLAEHPEVHAVMERLDGEMLDRIGELWYRGKGMPTPEARLRGAARVSLRGWTPGDMLPYEEALGGVRADLYHLEDGWYEAMELYCAAPGCTCGEVVIDVAPAEARGRPHIGRVVVERSGAARLEPEGNGRERLQQVWLAFQKRHPSYRARLARRDAAMKELGSRIVPEAPLRTEANPKIGRNDPCPCGSGKKHKKCCGAA